MKKVLMIASVIGLLISFFSTRKTKGTTGQTPSRLKPEPGSQNITDVFARAQKYKTADS